jgi:hypothetical protein
MQTRPAQLLRTMPFLSINPGILADVPAETPHWESQGRPAQCTLVEPAAYR